MLKPERAYSTIVRPQARPFVGSRGLPVRRAMGHLHGETGPLREMLPDRARCPSEDAYSKHAVIGLTRAAALEYGKSGIRINAVCPAAIETDMYHRFVADPNV